MGKFIARRLGLMAVAIIGVTLISFLISHAAPADPIVSNLGQQASQRPEIVKDLVRGIAESGEWAETHRLDAAKVAAPYFRQDEKVVRHVLTQPPDRVSYRMLTPTDEDLQRIQDMGIKAGILEKRVPMSELIDRRFIPKEIKPANIVVGSAAQ